MSKKNVVITEKEGPKEGLTTEDATQVLRAEAQKRINQCGQEVNQALIKYNCVLIAQMILTAGNVPEVRYIIQPKQG